VEPLSDLSVAAPPEKRAEIRVPFLSLIEGGYVKPGETLVDERRRHRATVRADGTLALPGNIVGSIHKVGALVQGLPACNGWTFWHVERGKALTCIDAFRAKVRETMAG
jgi:modification methylase